MSPELKNILNQAQKLVGVRKAFACAKAFAVPFAERLAEKAG
jgi:hypothetical protein